MDHTEEETDVNGCETFAFKYIIQLLVFAETNIKIYWCVKGDVNRRESEVNISFHTPINLDINLFSILVQILC